MPDKFGWDNNFGNNPAARHKALKPLEPLLPGETRSEYLERLERAEVGKAQQCEPRYRPDWNHVMGAQASPDDNHLVIITRGTARLAVSAVLTCQEETYYHNFGAAEAELLAVLARPVPSDQQKIENLNASLAECEHYCATKTGATECNCGSWYFRRSARQPEGGGA